VTISTTHARVRYGETDQMGVVYHANYLVYFEIGRTDLIRSLGVSYAELEKDGLRLPVVDLGVRFHEPARYDEELAIETRLTKVTGVRLVFEYTVRRVGEDRVLAEGHTTLASVDENGRPLRFPPAVRARLSAASES